MAAPVSATAIVNPTARRGARRALLKWLSLLAERELGEDGARIQWSATERPGDATAMTRSALELGATTILSVGGDGTHNEVLQGFLDETDSPVNPEARLALIDQGTSGDFCRSLGVGPGPEACFRAITRGETRTIDIGTAEFSDSSGDLLSVHFLNVASVGIGGLVDYLVARSQVKWAGGRAAFALATAQALVRYRPKVMKIALDDGPEEEHLVCSLAVAAKGHQDILPGPLPNHVALAARVPLLPDRAGKPEVAAGTIAAAGTLTYPCAQTTAGLLGALGPPCRTGGEPGDAGQERLAQGAVRFGGNAVCPKGAAGVRGV